MSETNYDAVIVGGGISGLIAGISLLDRGARVAVISRGDPVACLSTGCIDLLVGCDNPIAAVESLPENHPYRLIGRKEIIEALDYFLKAVSSAGLAYSGNPEKNRGIVTPLGTIKTTCLVPQSMVHSPEKRGESLHIVSFAGLKDFYPGYIKARFRNSEFSIFDAGVSPTMTIAELFEMEKFRSEFVDWLKCTDIAGEKVGIPAVLGIEGVSEVLKEIEEGLNRPVFEIPTLPPSVPGIRLFRALKRRFQKGGGDLYWGKPVASMEGYGKIIEAVTVATRGRSTRVNGRAFILATGSFVSGGLHAGIDQVEEPVFGLPVFVPASRDAWFGENFYPPSHPIEKAGIAVDRSFRPKEAGWENLFVCGSILAFSEVMKNGCGHGMALATGVAAAKSCREYLGVEEAKV